MANPTIEEIKDRMNFDTLFAKDKILTDAIRSSFKRPAASKANAPEDADPVENWKSSGWMDDLALYMENMEKDEKNPDMIKKLQELGESVKSIKEEIVSGNFEDLSKNLELSKKAQAHLYEFHTLTNFEHVMDPHFQALGGLIREFKDITEQRIYDKRNTEIAEEAERTSTAVSTLPDSTMNFRTAFNKMTQEANLHDIILDQKLMQNQIDKLDKEIDSIEEKLPEDPRQIAFLHQVPHLIAQLSEDGVAMLNEQRKIAAIERMNKIIDRQPKEKQEALKKSQEFLIMQKDLALNKYSLERVSMKIDQKIGSQLNVLQKYKDEYAERHGLKTLNLKDAARRDKKVSDALEELSRLAMIHDEKGNIDTSLVNNCISIDKKIVDEILKHENYMLNRAVSRAELIKAQHAIKQHEKNGINMTFDQLQEDYAEAEKKWKSMNVQGPKLLRQRRSKMMSMQNMLTKLKNNYTTLQGYYPNVNKPLVNDPTAKESAEITEQLQTLYDKRDACKGDHTNSTEFDRMIAAIEACQQEPNQANMENLQEQAQRYLDAKMKWDMFHLKPTKLRFQRLDYAREIIEFAKQNKNLYEPVQLSEKVTQTYQAAVASSKRNASGIFENTQIKNFDGLVKSSQYTTEKRMNARTDRYIRETHEALNPKPVEEKNNPEVVLNK